MNANQEPFSHLDAFHFAMLATVIQAKPIQNQN